MVKESNGSSFGGWSTGVVLNISGSGLNVTGSGLNVTAYPFRVRGRGTVLIVIVITDGYSAEAMEDNLAVLFLQKRYRGYKARRLISEQRKQLEYQEIHLAAFVIQRSFRKWRAYISTPHPTVFDIYSTPSNATKKGESKTQYWQRIKAGKGTFQDKVILWRNIIDIRRDNPKISSELCLHAIFEADGNLSKAQIHLLSMEFVADHELKQLTSEQQDFFMPYTSTLTRRSGTNNKASRNLYSSLNEANITITPHHIGLRKSFFYRKQGNRNPTPGYLKQYENLRRQGQLDPMKSPSRGSVFRSPPKGIRSPSASSSRSRMSRAADGRNLLEKPVTLSSDGRGASPGGPLQSLDEEPGHQQMPSPVNDAAIGVFAFMNSDFPSS